MVDKKKRGDHFGVKIISGSIWGSSQGWGSWRDQDHFGGCTEAILGFTTKAIKIKFYNQDVMINCILLRKTKSDFKNTKANFEKRKPLGASVFP